MRKKLHIRLYETSCYIVPTHQKPYWNRQADPKTETYKYPPQARKYVSKYLTIRNHFPKPDNYVARARQTNNTAGGCGPPGSNSTKK